MYITISVHFFLYYYYTYIQWKHTFLKYIYNSCFRIALISFHWSFLSIFRLDSWQLRTLFISVHLFNICTFFFDLPYINVHLFKEMYIFYLLKVYIFSYFKLYILILLLYIFVFIISFKHFSAFLQRS